MTVIDVGAYDGLSFALPCSENPDAIVHAIEPNPALVNRLRTYNRPNLHVHHFAAGEVEGTFPFNINLDAQTSSLLPATCGPAWQDFKEQLQLVDTIEVPVRRLDVFFASEGITEIEILKIDAQGLDFQVLKGAGDAIHSVRSILLEVQLQPLYLGSATKEDILDYLSDCGFELVRCVPQTNGLEENLEFLRQNRYKVFPTASTPFQVTVPHAGNLTLPDHDHVGHLLEQGTFECWEQAFLWLYLREGDTFLDCGAHVGLFSAVAAQCISNQGKIIGIEPNRACGEIYAKNLKSLGCQVFQLIECGLSNTDGKADLQLGKPGMSAFSSLAPTATDQAQIGADKITVKLRHLDSIISELALDTIALAKLDVEGWELFALEGAEESIRARKLPVWLIEFTDENAAAAGRSILELWQRLEYLGYTLCRFDLTRLQLVPEHRKRKYPYENLVAVMDLDDANNRLAAADRKSFAIAKDIIARWDTVMDRQSLLRKLTHLQSLYEQQQHQFSNQYELLLDRLDRTEASISPSEADPNRSSPETAPLSPRQQILRGWIKSNLCKLGLYESLYAQRKILAPIYNWLFRDPWTLEKLTKGKSSNNSIEEP